MIRTATREDLPAILAIYNDAILHTTAIYDYIPHTLDERTRWFEQLRSAGYPLFVAEEKTRSRVLPTMAASGTGPPINTR